jgi:hypothetical protein
MTIPSNIIGYISNFVDSNWNDIGRFLAAIVGLKRFKLG